MKKTVLTLTLLIILSTIVWAVSFTFDTATWESTPPETTRYSGNVTFFCDGEPQSVFLSEPNLNIDDDVEKEISHYCNGIVSNVEDWTGRIMKQNEYGLKSFDEVKLKKDNCKQLNKTYDKKNDDCKDKKGEKEK